MYYHYYSLKFDNITNMNAGEGGHDSSPPPPPLEISAIDRVTGAKIGTSIHVGLDVILKNA